MSLLKLADAWQTTRTRHEFAGIPTSDRQSNWRYSIKDKTLSLNKENRTIRFELGEYEDEHAKAGLPMPLKRIHDTDRETFEENEDIGTLQVHRSTPTSIHATMQDGKKNSSFTIRKDDSGEWAFHTHAPKKSRAQQAREFVDGVKTAGLMQGISQYTNNFLQNHLSQNELNDIDKAKAFVNQGKELIPKIKSTAPWIQRYSGLTSPTILNPSETKGLGHMIDWMSGTSITSSPLTQSVENTFRKDIINKAKRDLPGAVMKSPATARFGTDMAGKAMELGSIAIQNVSHPISEAAPVLSSVSKLIPLAGKYLGAAGTALTIGTEVNNAVKHPGGIGGYYNEGKAINDVSTPGEYAAAVWQNTNTPLRTIALAGELGSKIPGALINSIPHSIEGIPIVNKLGPAPMVSGSKFPIAGIDHTLGWNETSPNIPKYPKPTLKGAELKQKTALLKIAESLDRSSLPFRESAEGILLHGNDIIGQRMKGYTGNTFIKIPGGGIDPGETHRQGLERELMEEAGVTAKNLKRHGHSQSIWLPSFAEASPGCADKYNRFQGFRRHVYSGIVDKISDPTSQEGDDMKGEIKIPIHEAISFVKDQIANPEVDSGGTNLDYRKIQLSALERLSKMLSKKASLVIGAPDNRPDKGFDKKEMSLGLKEELDHSKSVAVRKEIAKDHLEEDPKYYSKEKEASDQHYHLIPEYPCGHKGEINCNCGKNAPIIESAVLGLCPVCRSKKAALNLSRFKEIGANPNTHAIEVPGINNAFYFGPDQIGSAANILKDHPNLQLPSSSKDHGVVLYDPSYKDEEYMAHEAGHSSIQEGGGLSAWNQNTARKLGLIASILAPGVGALVGHHFNSRAAGAVSGAGLAALGQAPMLINEHQATSRAKKYLEERGIDSSKLNDGLGSYWTNAAISTGLAGALGLYGKYAALKKDKDFEKDVQEAVNLGKVKHDITYYYSVDEDRCLVNTGDWHSEQEAKAAAIIPRKYFSKVEVESEAGKPSWEAVYFAPEFHKLGKIAEFLKQAGWLTPVPTSSPTPDPHPAFSGLSSLPNEGTTEMRSPLDYKQQVYGPSLWKNLRQAQNYNSATGSSIDIRDWNKNYPVNVAQDRGNITSLSDVLNPINKSHQNLTGQGPTYLPSDVSKDVNKDLSSSTQTIPGVFFPGPERLDLYYRPIAQDPEKYNLSKNNVEEISDPRFALKHEMIHAGIEGDRIPKQEPTLDGNYPVLNTPKGHEFEPEEQKNYLSQLQEHQFKNTGSRITSPEQYDSLIHKIPFGTPKFEESIHPYPADVQRIFRGMNDVHKTEPKLFENSLQYQRKTVPGLVQQQSSLGKIAEFLKQAFVQSVQIPDLSSIPTPVQAVDNVANHVLKDVPKKEKGKLRRILDLSALGLASGAAAYEGAGLMFNSDKSIESVKNMMDSADSIAAAGKGPNPGSMIRAYIDKAVPVAQGTLFGFKANDVMKVPRIIPGLGAGDDHHYSSFMKGPLTAWREFVPERFFRADGRYPVIPGYENDPTAKQRFIDAGDKMIAGAASSLGIKEPIDQMSLDQHNKVWGIFDDYWKKNSPETWDMKQRAEALVGSKEYADAQNYRWMILRPLMQTHDFAKNYIGPGLVAAGGVGLAYLASQILRHKKDKQQKQEDRLQKVSEFLKLGDYRSELKAKITHQRATVHTTPTKAQQEAGNYRKGHVWIQGLDITIENPKGSVRSGVGKDGKPWRTRMASDYGYLRNHKRGADGDHVDCFIGTHPDSEIVYIIDQVNSEGKFDEHKCVIGCLTESDAKDLYLSNYSKGWKGLGSITALTMVQFKRWLKSGDTSKPLSGQNMKDFSKKASKLAVLASKIAADSMTSTMDALTEPLTGSPSIPNIAYGALAGVGGGALWHLAKKIRGNNESTLTEDLMNGGLIGGGVSAIGQLGQQWVPNKVERSPAWRGDPGVNMLSTSNKETRPFYLNN